jgi:uncharacterized protein
VVFKLAFLVISAVLATKFLFANGAWQWGAELRGRSAMIIIGFRDQALFVVNRRRRWGALKPCPDEPWAVDARGHRSLGWHRDPHIVRWSRRLCHRRSGAAGAGSAVLSRLCVPGVALMAPVATLVAPYGVRLAHALSKRRLETTFGLYLIAVAVRFVVSLF